MKGTLVVKPLNAVLRYDTRVFLKMCPFCIFQLDGQAGTTRPCKNGGKHPMWEGQSVELQKKEAGFTNFQLRIELIDEQLWADENIGQVEVLVDRQLDIGRKSSKTVTAIITRKGTHIGEMTMLLEWEPVPLSVRTTPHPRSNTYQQPIPKLTPPPQIQKPRSDNQLPEVKPPQPPRRRFTAQQMDNLLAD